MWFLIFFQSVWLRYVHIVLLSSSDFNLKIFYGMRVPNHQVPGLEMWVRRLSSHENDYGASDNRSFAATFKSPLRRHVNIVNNISHIHGLDLLDKMSALHPPPPPPELILYM